MNVKGWMNGWMKVSIVNYRMNKWIKAKGWINEWMNEGSYSNLQNEWMHECMTVRMNKRKWMNEWMDEEGPYSKLQHLLIPLRSLLLTPGTEWT